MAGKWVCPIFFKGATGRLDSLVLCMLGAKPGQTADGGVNRVLPNYHAPMGFAIALFHDHPAHKEVHGVEIPNADKYSGR